jgi:putative pyruvate formate lyase activating enzyme
MSTPGYVRLALAGELERRIDVARGHLSDCRLCPRACGVDRSSGETGYCGAGPSARVYSHMAHPGEEPPISGSRGSGTIFFSHCTLSCIYCQNCAFSQLGEGTDRTVSELAEIMSSLARAGCHNLNLVTPTHFLPAVLEALLESARAGVSLPLVWNTSSYETPETLALLDGLVDVYLADLRYWSAESAGALSYAPDYPEVSRRALAEMRRQVGALRLGEDGTASRGLIVRHLVLPGGLSGTAEAMRFVADVLGTDTHVSLMSQYYPAHLAVGHPLLRRRLTRAEWDEAVRSLEEAGLENGWVQDYPEDLYPAAGTRLRPDD